MLRPGDVVVMNDKYYVSPEDKGREWKVRSKPWVVCGQEIVLLEGKTGGYATDGLSLLSRLPEPPKEGGGKDGN